MPIEMLKGLPFSVDTWSSKSRTKRHHFLTHAHKDHTQGICIYGSYPIYCSRLTRTLVLQHFPQLDGSFFVGIEVGQCIVIKDPDGDFTVTALDANHCPGALMFLYEGKFGNFLHTGDCRLTIECLQQLPLKYVGTPGKEPKCQIDCIFLDCTFGQSPLKMPSRQSAMQQIINCIWKHPQAPTVYLTCDLLGHEEILMHVSQTFGCKIYVDKAKTPECFQALELMVPEILAEDTSSRFQLFDGFPKLYQRAEAKIAQARSDSQHEPLIIRASAQWYACDDGISDIESRKKGRCDQPVRDIFGVWHICYSIHSSKEELEWALQLLAPRWVISTTPSCKALELDYVKRLFNQHRNFNDPFWQLLGFSMDVESEVDVETAPDVVEVSSSALAKSNAQDYADNSQLTTSSFSICRQSNLSPPSKTATPVTLFGRARFGLNSSYFKHEEKEPILPDENAVIRCSDELEVISLKKEEVVVEAGKALAVSESLDIMSKESLMHTETENCIFESAVGLSNSYNPSLRKLYRSMHVPVPRPLPSLTELMNATKRARRRL
ncbi:5' exonuclease Apollo [Solanum tuberosum]|uniref:5' exonuclease Apollo n=1 Tax=Solanum tuberosum TaxID=4113 RepID=UPI0003D2892E|nr:PREDICTED: 5' exonuclease Apollo [Solanum tuberosum]